MKIENRITQRFPLTLTIKGVDNRFIAGEFRDFSRNGARILLNSRLPAEKSEIQISIQRPDYNEDISANASVVWKKDLGDKCEIGIRFKQFPPHAKADFLEYGYKRWLQQAHA